jgi:antitoxin YefM
LGLPDGTVRRQTFFPDVRGVVNAHETSNTYGHVDDRADVARGRKEPALGGRGPLQREHGRVVITKHGHPAAVVISLDDLESLEETLDVMDSAALLDDIREALADSDAQVLCKEEALRLIADR